MELADASSVLGDFDESSFTHHGVTSTFYKEGETFMVRTDGANGDLAEFEIAYTFGVYPLQQYLVRFPKGRVQALPLCWDARPESEGGQRWYHLYGDEKIAHDDALHWTGRQQTWNHQCASCHSTGLVRGYDLATDAYDTTWNEIDVSCEACHGPGSHHVEWAEGGASESDNGLVVSLRNDTQWVFESGEHTAKRVQERTTDAEVEACAPCHSRRTEIVAEPGHGRRLFDTHRVSPLAEGLYHADGQILDEVYVYGSFVQSKMYHAGVTCSDCHEPHSLTLRADGNALCVRCHQPATFDTRDHHMHEPGSAAAQCVSCHMPETTYMGVDARRDHSLRVPRPDLTVTLGTPNACNGCHVDRSAKWAADAIDRNVAGAAKRPPHFATALHAGRERPGTAATRRALSELALDPTVAAIARASALHLLAEAPSEELLRSARVCARDPSPQVRAAALAALDALAPAVRVPLATPLLGDPMRSVRTEAARVLAGVPRERLPDAARFDRALREYVDTQRANADQPWAHANLGILHTRLGDADAAERSLRRAVKLDPGFVPGYVNLADLLRSTGRDADGERVLRAGLRQVGDSADLRHALGLLLVRSGRTDEALGELRLAASDNARFAYTYGIALHSTGDGDEALRTLAQYHASYPSDRDILLALATIARDRGDVDRALTWARKLLALDASDRATAQLIRELVARQRNR